MLMLMKCNALKEAKHLRCYKGQGESSYWHDNFKVFLVVARDTGLCHALQRPHVSQNIFNAIKEASRNMVKCPCTAIVNKINAIILIK
jgi:hypothetical protein